ncbi:MAG: DNA-binding protein WhiA [Firmicutes bacterium]|nr:DNA-binding protein WhiA [Bacillota bacterium]
MSFSSEVREELLSIKMWDLSSRLSQEGQLARLYIREAFIKSGFINDPNKEYHLEILFKNNKKADKVKQILDNFAINSKVTKKGNNIMLYIKDGEDISEFLALIGANDSVIKFEEIRVVKDTRNNINRLVNCETANLNKTVNAAVEQAHDIELLKKNGMFEELEDSLKEVAELRLQNLDISYEELGKMLKKPISKSGVSHRLAKISRIAREGK